MAPEYKQWMEDLFERTKRLGMTPVYTHMKLAGADLYSASIRGPLNIYVADVSASTLKELLQMWDVTVGEIERSEGSQSALVPSKSESKRISIQQLGGSGLRDDEPRQGVSAKPKE